MAWLTTERVTGGDFQLFGTLLQGPEIADCCLRISGICKLLTCTMSNELVSLLSENEARPCLGETETHVKELVRFFRTRADRLT